MVRMVMSWRPWIGWGLGCAPWVVAITIGSQGISGSSQISHAARYDDVEPILRAHCVSCHSGQQPAGGLDLASPSGLARGGAHGKAVEPGQPDRSLLLRRLTEHSDLQPRMPLGFAPLANTQIATIRQWIEAGARTESDAPTFGKHILPILRAHCTTCHASQDAAAGLDLSGSEGFRKGGASGPLIVPGDPARSLLVRRLKGLDGKPQMPMGFVPLGAEKLRLIEEWIASGASMSEDSRVHWAYVAPVRPPVPRLPGVGAIHPIDAFVRARLIKEGLKPSLPASKETLIRRVTLDLTGLPPTLAEVDAFLADRSPNAYEKVVDRLLASPHYGERQARIWLDLARYADSDGYEKDLRRTAWLYRDWVVNAFNSNMPFDRFTIEQIAGDLLPKPTQAQLIATGFHRNTMFNQEGGVDQMEAHYEVVLDRVATTASVWLGSTMACARCHDHKYDPFTQRDFYAMYAFFGNSVIRPRGSKEISEEKWYETEMSAPTPTQQKRLIELEREIALCNTQLNKPTPELMRGFRDWRQSLASPVDWTVLRFEGRHVAGGGKAHPVSDGSYWVDGPNPPQDRYTLSTNLAEERDIAGLRLEAIADDRLPGRGPGRAPNGNFVVTGVSVTLDGKPIDLADAAADFTQAQFDPGSVVARDSKRGWAIVPQTGQSHVWVVDTANPIRARKGQELKVVIACDSPYSLHNLGRFRISVCAQRGAASRLQPADIVALAKTRELPPDAEQALLKRYLSSSPMTREIRDRRARAQTERDRLKAEIPTALIMKDKPHVGPLYAYIHKRGEYLSPTEKVRANTPTFLPPMDPKWPLNRFGLAKWLVDRRNPLTARVEVNRIWEQYFGRGIVQTLEDFGTQGAAPSHPELLDWLAVELMESGWNLKAIHRLIVTSETYKQSSRVSPALLTKDPDNVLLARGPRFRLEAEAIRDSALAISGLLNRKIGGPSVFPYQPPGVWNNPFDGSQWIESTGGDQYRRSIYTFMRRTSPYPALIAFDGTSRESCTVRRVRTNTPLQALALLNDLGMIQAAKALGRRMMVEGGSRPSSRVAYGFRLCTARYPTNAEKERLVALFDQVYAEYQLRPDEARVLAGDPQQAAWCLVANVLLNLDETITKE